MIIKGKSCFDTQDVMQVNEGYVVSLNSSYSPCFNEAKIDGKDFKKPGFGVYKIHKDHPMRISLGYGSFSPYIKPILPEGDNRLLGQWIGDMLVHDFAYFTLLPMDIDLEKQNTAWKKIAVVDEAFVREDGRKGPVSVLYIDHGWNNDSMDTRIAFPALQTQIPYIFFLLFLKNEHEIDTLTDKMFDFKLEGKIIISWEDARKITKSITPKLEERFGDVFQVERDI